MTVPPEGEHTLHLIHHEGDDLCCWKPGRELLDQCCAKYTYIINENAAYDGYFGSSDHNHSHSVGLDLPGGRLEPSQLLFWILEAAARAKRDATPLRLISWPSFQLDVEVEKMIEAAMFKWVIRLS